jgi:hypothetical protein
MWEFQNWSRTRSHTVPIRFQPTNVRQLVAAVQAAENASGAAKAIGTGWSYPDVAIAPGVRFAIGTDLLFKVLSGTDPMSLIPFALNDVARADARHLLHVEAGIKIHDLNCTLDTMGLAMITLGGSNGQSLAGAISTGTHGSDVDLAPLADVVRAIHLVGPGGQEWWIERSGARAITDPARMEQARSANLLCSSIRIEYDDLLFNAVLVSVGRMGVVYSYVVQVRDAFRLKQTREKKNWTEVKSLIRTDIRDGLAQGTQFVEIAVNPYMSSAGDHDCVITRRKTVSEPTTSPGDSSGQSFAFFCNITALNAVLDFAAGLLPPLIAAATGAALASLSWMLLIPGLGSIAYASASAIAITGATAGLVALEAAIGTARATPGSDLAQKLTSILNTMTGLGHKELVPLLTEQMLLSERNPNGPVVVQESFRLLTSQGPCNAPWSGPPDCMRQVDGLEFALDLSPGSEKLFAFVDDVIALTDEFLATNMPAGFVMSLRFTKGTEALIGMQQFSRTCSVEVLMLRGLNGESDFLQRLYGIARLHDAIPHWGLIHEVDAAELRRLYGNRLHDWCVILRRLIDQGGGKTQTFSTSYTVTRGLEPLSGGLTISNNLPVAIPLWDPTPAVEGTTSTTGMFLWNRSNHSTQVSDIQFTTPDDVPGVPVFRLLTSCPISVAAGQVLLVDVTFSPAKAGAITGLVQVDCDDPLTPEVRLPLATSAIAIGRHAELQLAPASLDFGTTLINAPVGRDLTVTNIGFYAADFDNIAVTLDQPAGQLTASAVLARLPGGQSDTIYVSYNPTIRGAAHATLVIDMRSRTDVGWFEYRHRYELPLAGVALRPTIFLARRPLPHVGGPMNLPIGSGPGRPPLPHPIPLGDLELKVLDFGGAAPNTNAFASFWVRNVGDAPLTAQNVVVMNHTYFGVNNPNIFPATLQPGREIEVACGFRAPPISGLPIVSELRVTSDDPLRPTASLTLKGKAAGPHMVDPPELIDLGVVPPAPASVTVAFRSDGTDQVNVWRVTLAKGTDFSVSGAPQMPAQLAPGTELSLTVTLTATHPGYYQDQLLVAHDGRPSRMSQVLLRGRVA